MTEHSAILLDGIQCGSLKKCPHCGGHFLVAASGNLSDGLKAMGNIAHPRVHCRKCGRDTCGRACCDPALIGCTPVEARLEYAEGRQTQYTEAITEVVSRFGGI